MPRRNEMFLYEKMNVITALRTEEPKQKDYKKAVDKRKKTKYTEKHVDKANKVKLT